MKTLLALCWFAGMCLSSGCVAAPAETGDVAAPGAPEPFAFLIDWQAEPTDIGVYLARAAARGVVGDGPDVRLATRRRHRRLHATPSRGRKRTMETAAGLGFRLPDFTIETATPPNRQRACFRARKVLEEIVYDTVALENNPFTFPEVKTLIEGVTVGGHKIEDAQQVLNQAQSWRRLLHEVATGAFVPFTAGLDSALRLHALAAKEEALEWGVFRTGPVTIAGTDFEPPPWQSLGSVFEAGLETLHRIDDFHERAIATFLFGALNQFFYDGNKRTSRLMMNGVLLSAGEDGISVPARRALEFNEAMIRFYDTRDGSEMMRFMNGCSLDPDRSAEES
jgi:hypothetical protein